MTLVLYEYARADVLGGPLPAPRMPRDIVPLTPVEKLGKLMLYDSTLSNPPGYACASCHVAETGYTGQNSEINAFSGPQPGVVPGRYSDRKPVLLRDCRYSWRVRYTRRPLKSYAGRSDRHANASFVAS